MSTSTATTRMPALLIAGTHSGVGKTTLTAGLLRAWRERGLAVQPFKAGPDYIDPTYHALAAGRPCRNLDPWLLPPEALQAALALAASQADLAVIEGVMGLFDGYGYDGDEGSTAHLARVLDVPIVLVLDVSSMGRSAAALASGYANFRSDLRLAGFILNRAGSAAHGVGCARAITNSTGLPCFGWLPRAAGLEIPERHLGLVPTVEPGRWETFIADSARLVSAQVDLKALLSVAGGSPFRTAAAGESGPALGCSADSSNDGAGAARPDGQSARTLPNTGSATVAGPVAGRPRIAVARDAAFSFYYEDNLDLLRAAGAEIMAFSPLQDDDLPPSSAALYLGGGFPEVYAAGLAANARLRCRLQAAIAGGLPTYAECGGLMYLTEAIQGPEGPAYPMVGALPGRSVMTPGLTMGYRLARTGRNCFLAPANLALRGHEFHYSEWERPADAPAAYWLRSRPDEPEQAEGYASAHLVASYLHVHWLALPDLAARFVAAARSFAATGGPAASPNPARRSS